MVLLGSDKFGTCQAKMGQPSLQLSKKGHHQRNKEMREGAFRRFSVFSPLVQVAAQARQCHLAPLFDTHLLVTNKKAAMSVACPTVILSSIPPCRSLFSESTNLTQVRIHPCHNLACSLLLLLTSSPSQHFLFSKPTYTAEPCMVSEELAHSSPCQGPLS